MSTEPLRRSTPTQLQRVDRRTLQVRFVPFDVVANVADPTPEGGVDRYREMFAATVFDRQITAASKADGVFQRITMVDEHHEGLGKVGFTTDLRREADGVYGTVRLLPSKVPDVEALLDEGVDKVSVEFLAHRGGTRTLTDGTRVRHDAHLLRVALVAQGAYDGSEVLAMREAEDLVAEVGAEYTAQMDELDSWLAAESARQGEWKARLGG